MQVPIFFALLAFSSAAKILQGPSFKTVNLGVDGSIVHSASFGGNVLEGVQPIVTGVHVPHLKTVNVYPDGTLVNTNGIVQLVPTSLMPVTTGIQGPSSRTVSVGPDGSVIDSFTAGGVVSDDGSVLVAPSLHTAHHTIVPANGVVPGTNVLYAPGFYSSFVPIPYGKSVVAGPSGTIVAKWDGNLNIWIVLSDQPDLKSNKNFFSETFQYFLPQTIFYSLTFNIIELTESTADSFGLKNIFKIFVNIGSKVNQH